jgi:phosphate-selective porin OprO/OprP
MLPSRPTAVLTLAVVVGLSATPSLAQSVQSGGGGSGGSEAPAPGKTPARQPLGNGAPQNLGQAAAKKPPDGALPFFAAYSRVLPEGGRLSVDTKGITVQTVDDAVKLRIGGRVQLDTSAASLSPRSLGPALGSGDNVLLRRAYFESYLTLYDAVEVAFQYDFANETQPIQDAVLAYRGFDHVILSAGNFKEPFGLDQLRSDNTTTFAERALTNALFPSRNFGGAIGTYGDNWTITAGVFGGNANTSATTGNTTIEDNGIAGTARITYAPILTQDQLLHFGIAGSYRSQDPTNTNLSFSARPEDQEFARALVSTGTLRNATETGRLGLEAIYQYGSYRITSEYAVANVGGVTPTTAVANRGDRFFQSGYVEGAWVVNGYGRPYRLAPTYGSEFAVLQGVEIDDAQRISRGGFGVFEVAARYSVLDLEDGSTRGGRLQDVTAGVNWYPDRNIRVVADYVHGHADPAPVALNVSKIDSDAFIGRLQFNW